MCSYVEALCQLGEQSDNYFWGYCIFMNGDTKSVVLNALECLSSRWNVMTFSYWYCTPELTFYNNQSIDYEFIAFRGWGIQRVTLLLCFTYHNVRIRVPLLPEIGKTPILADFYVVSIFHNSVAIHKYFSASVTGTLTMYRNIIYSTNHVYLHRTNAFWFLAAAFAPVLQSTQTRFKLFWIGLRIRNAFGMNRNCTFCVCLFSQILICDLWALDGFSFIQNF